MIAVSNAPPRQKTARVLLASLIGTTVEFYDFYIYATAASLIFGPLFFPAALQSAELISAYASFGLAFVARPIGGAVFGHFGDRVGRKATLVASLLLMGLSTSAIGLLPTFALAGWLAPVLLCLLRFGQGLALGGEWSGAALLALENAPPGWRARYAMFAPLGAPLGFFVANGLFLVLTLTLSAEQFADWGWRVPFLLSVPLVWLGLWVRTNLGETEEFTAAVKDAQPPRVPFVALMRHHAGQVVAGMFGVVACFSLFWTATAFALGYGTTTLGYSRASFLTVELGAILFMAAAIVVASWLSDRLDPARVLIVGCAGTIASGILLAPMLGSGSLATIFVFLAFALWVMGFVNGPLGAWLPSLFPPQVRYTGTSVAFNVGGIIGGAFSPMIAQALAERSGLTAVGFYLALTGGISLIAFDTSARQRALGALARSERRYRALFEQSHVALCEVDLSGAQAHLAEARAAGPGTDLRGQADAALAAACARQIALVDVNDATVQLLGCRSRDAVLGSMSRFLPPGNDLVLPLLQRLDRAGGRFEAQGRLIRADGREVTVILVVALPDDPAAFDRVACAMIDVTERERAKEALLAAQAELARAGRVSTVGAISASIAHEVNQPIGAMVMSAEACLRWLRRETPDLEAAARAAERAVRDGMRASRIVQRTREQLRRDRSQPEIVDLQPLLAEVVALLDREILAAGATVRTLIAATEARVLADRVEMQQVVVNLVTNGLHAMRDAPETRRELRIALSAPAPGRLRIAVSDSGTGIDPEQLPKLFSPFFTTKRDGMGIGLAICRTIVESHGGTLTARNNDSPGATFAVDLPAAEPDRESRAAEPAAASA
ncbi:MFS transporter [Methylobacterium radiotolerans]|uniref:histidine kinase n=1 Tax=Methylobacterium radiotolerans (strain ATCC 27329 / DSM 1819 / JCM 2831 / NBRC 15690 / NCIMB 10815 / 0-1) TaxID=426355 RepID=B1M2Y0_METRJ|nr:multi-sensor signal transduction histidine kinase [Methylobacterium radiotolerans JCM 2831]